jgi:KaiC/GvpD/RAD55 family RecA-like ATPase
MARRGRVSIVVCAEERAAAVRERLVLFGQLDSRRYDVIDRQRLEKLLDRPYESELADGSCAKGLLVIYTARRLPDARDRGAAETIHVEREIARIADEARARAQFAKSQNKASRWKWLSLTLDSIDALEVDDSRLEKVAQASAERKALNVLVTSFQKNGLWGIIVCGAHNPQRVPLSYLSDTVIELGTDASGMQRSLQIHKCRTQPYDHGVHIHELLEGIGSVVYPNLASVQRWLHRRARGGLDRDNIVRVPGWIDWPRGEQRSESVTDVPDESWSIQRGASVLLYGGPQAGKAPFLLNLMAQRMSLRRYPEWRLGANGAVHIISFRRGEQEFLRPLSESAPLARAWNCNIADVQQHWYAADEARQAAHITYDIMRAIQRSRRDGLPLEWIVFLGIEAVKTNFPAVNAEKSFWPTVLAITSSEQISTAFIVSDAAGTGSFVSEHREDMDYVFRFERNRHQRGVHIERSVESPLGQGYPVLSFDPLAGEITLEYEVDSAQAHASGTFHSAT